MPITDKPIAVTGASGFIASHIVQQLLAAGYRVRGTVRDASKTSDTSHLTGLAGASERLDLVSANLLDASAFDAVVKGCEYVLHTASPYAIDVKDPQKDLVDPAVKGTRNVLDACARSGSVKRVVLTSSMAAITDEPESDRALTEDDWNTRSTLDRNPYYLSKTLAEREAWKIVKDEKAGFDLVVINPFVVLGPSLGASLNTSNQILVDLVNGTYPGIMSIAWGIVDVRDVARSHVLAFETPAASGRYICANTTLTMRALVEILAKRGIPEQRLPKLGLDCSAGDFAVKLGSYLQPRGVGSFLRTHLGRTPRFDHAKIERDLGLTFTPLETTINDTIDDLQRWRHIKSA
jgi:dihydroflavonol-4-reductase